MNPGCPPPSRENLRKTALLAADPFVSLPMCPNATVLDIAHRGLNETIAASILLCVDYVPGTVLMFSCYFHNLIHLATHHWHFHSQFKGGKTNAEVCPARVSSDVGTCTQSDPSPSPCITATRRPQWSRPRCVSGSFGLGFLHGACEKVVEQNYKSSSRPQEAVTRLTEGL